MGWFRLDDQGAFHEKVLAVGNEAYGAWCRAGQWSSGHLTEGRIPRSTAMTLARPRIWMRLVEVRLCESLGDDGYQIHDYLDWNPTAVEALAKKAARAEAGRRGGYKKEANRKQADSKPPSDGLAIASPVAYQNSTPSPSPSPSQSDPDLCPTAATPLVGPPVVVAVKAMSPVERVFAHYLGVRKRHRPSTRAVKLKPKERKRAAVLFAAGYSSEDLELACEGLFLSSHHTGSNDRGTPYVEFFHAMGESVVDGFIAAADEARQIAPAKVSEVRPVEEVVSMPDEVREKILKFAGKSDPAEPKRNPGFDFFDRLDAEDAAAGVVR